jgi:hypothetical protein
MTGSAVLTTASTLTCAHQGKVKADSSTRLRVGNKPVLLADVTNKEISRCVVVDNTNTSTLHCKTVSSVTAGQSARLTVGGTSVLLDLLVGSSDGTPPVPPSPGIPLSPAIANQTRLRAAVAVT